MITNIITKRYKVSGITCESCVKLIKKRLYKIPGISEVEIKNNEEMEIKSSREISKEEIEGSLVDTDYKIS